MAFRAALPDPDDRRSSGSACGPRFPPPCARDDWDACPAWHCARLCRVLRAGSTLRSWPFDVSHSRVEWTCRSARQGDDRRVDVDLVLLRLRPRLVLLVDIGDGAF